jgi:hypothetical protein
MTKKIIDALSAISIAIYFAVAIYAVVWEESPRAPGHLSIESKIAVWSGVPLIFGGCWLIVRYAKAASEKFPLVFGRPGHHGLLFYFVVIFFVYYWVFRISGWLFR